VTAVGQRLYDSAGKPLFFVADTAWLLCKRLSVQSAFEYLQTRKSQGFNTIIVGTDGSWWESPGVARMALWDKLRSICDSARALGMYVIPTIEHHEYDAATGRAFLRLPADKARLTGEKAANLLKDRPSVLFYMVGGLDAKGCISVAGIREIAVGISAVDPARLISYHPASGRTSLDVPLDANHDLVLYQSYQEVGYDANTRAMQTLAGTGRPFANIEPIYEGTYGGISGSPDQIERVAATCAKQPVCGMAYGHHDVWGFTDRWKTALNAPGVGKFVAWTRKAVRP
jgi:hypothetical protein